MADPEAGGSAAAEPVAWQQILLDDIGLLLLAGLVTPTIFYIIWGLIDLLMIPQMPR